ncbi:BON domain-containing protein [Spirillospora sp. NPDC029432]|uniref:BON domain-containing protein n=1 Tax=Spirillospora sp. NPDC029432 TaxID=3154599 RepID=UPI003455FEF9
MSEGSGHGGQAEYVAAHIQEKLAERVHELGVHVDVRGDVVYLRGQVMTEGQRREIEDAAHGAAEGRRIRNEVSVVSVREPDGEETLS